MFKSRHHYSSPFNSLLYRHVRFREGDRGVLQERRHHPPFGLHEIQRHVDHVGGRRSLPAVHHHLYSASRVENELSRGRMGSRDRRKQVGRPHPERRPVLQRGGRCDSENQAETLPPINRCSDAQGRLRQRRQLLPGIHSVVVLDTGM